MPAALPLILDINDPQQQGLLADFLTGTPTQISSLVRNDVALSLLVRPVQASISGERLYDDVFEDGDQIRVAIGLPDEPATGGTMDLSIDGIGTGLSGLDYNISANDLETPLSAASVTGGNPALSVELLSEGVYQIDGTTNGFIPQISVTSTNLRPVCNAISSVIIPGDGSTKGQQILVIKQSPVAQSQPNTPLPDAGVSATYDQVATSNQNAIVRISFAAEQTYGGRYAIGISADGVSASAGLAGPLISSQELGLILANHPSIHFQNETQPDNIIPSKDGEDYLVEFVDDLAKSALLRTVNGATVATPTVLTTSAAHGYSTGDVVLISNSSGITPSLNGTHTITVLSSTTFSIPIIVSASSSPSATVFNYSLLTVTNINLLAPKGVTGSIDLNTVNLAKKFYATTEDELTFEISVEWVRSSGEIRTILLGDITLKRDIIDIDSLAPIDPLATVLTTTTGVRFFGTITGYTGGTATDMDSIITTNQTVPQLWRWVHPMDGPVEFWFRDGTDAATTPPDYGIVRPVDFNASTNAKVLEQVS